MQTYEEGFIMLPKTEMPDYREQALAFMDMEEAMRGNPIARARLLDV